MTSGSGLVSSRDRYGAQETSPTIQHMLDTSWQCPPTACPSVSPSFHHSASTLIPKTLAIIASPHLHRLETITVYLAAIWTDFFPWNDPREATLCYTRSGRLLSAHKLRVRQNYAKVIVRRRWSFLLYMPKPCRVLLVFSSFSLPRFSPFSRTAVLLLVIRSPDFDLPAFSYPRPTFKPLHELL